MPEPSGAKQLYFELWYQKTHPDLDKEEARIVWDAAWEIAQESTYFEIDDYRNDGKTQDFERFLSEMLGQFESVRRERGWPKS